MLYIISCMNPLQASARVSQVIVQIYMWHIPDEKQTSVWSMVWLKTGHVLLIDSVGDDLFNRTVC